MTVQLKLQAETEAQIEVIGVAIRTRRGRVYSQRGATHASLIAFVKNETGEAFWSEVEQAELGLMMDNGEFIPQEAA